MNEVNTEENVLSGIQIQGMDTPSIISAHLRADKALTPETAEALSNMIRVAYIHEQAGQRRAKMRRGFKTWCEKEAAAIRKIMGLKDFDALSWEDLSKHMGIPVLDGASLHIAEKDRDQLFQKDHKSWDAFTVTVDDGKHMIFFNSKQPTPRITNTIMHELAHIICEHVPSTIMNMGLPVRTCDTKQEEEADWLSGSLLLPRTALLYLLKKGMQEEYIAQQFRVSSELLRYRINITGVKRQNKATKRS